MAIGERIHHFRLLRGFTQKYLGQQLGFSESQADVRIAQYEKGARSPKENYLNALADIFEISPHALAVPDIDSYVGLMHTLFTLEDLYGLHIGDIDGELCLRLDKSKGTTYLSMFDMFHAWQEQAEKLVQFAIMIPIYCVLTCLLYFSPLTAMVVGNTSPAVLKNKTV